MNYNEDLNFTFVHTPKILFGANVVDELGSTIGEMGFNKAVVITDQFIAEKTDLLQRIKKILSTRYAGVFDKVIPDPTPQVVDEGAAYAASLEADVLVSLGGGSSIDTAKGMAIVLKEGGKLLDHEGYHVLQRPLTPHVAIPTTAGTGSEMTMVTVIKDPERNQKTFVGSFFLHPDLAILDPTLTCGMPNQLTAATGTDALCHSIESMMSTLRQPFSDSYAIKAIRLISDNLPRCLENPNDLTARGQMLIAAALAGSAFSNAMANLNHALAHTVGARFGIHHGTANAIFIPHTMRFFIEDAKDQLAEVAKAMGVDTKGMSATEAASKAADSVESFMKKIGLSKKLHEYNVPEDRLEEIATVALSDGSIIYSPRPIFDPAEVLTVIKKDW